MNPTEPTTTNQETFKCSGPSCPGLPYRASDMPHPASCAKPKLDDDPRPRAVCSLCHRPCWEDAAARDALEVSRS